MCSTIGERTEGEGREREGSGDSGPVSVGSAGMSAEPIRLKQSSSHVTCRMNSAVTSDSVPPKIVSPPTPAILRASYVSAISRRDCTPTSFFRVMNLLSKGFRV